MSGGGLRKPGLWDGLLRGAWVFGYAGLIGAFELLRRLERKPTSAGRERPLKG